MFRILKNKLLPPSNRISIKRANQIYPYHKMKVGECFVTNVKSFNLIIKNYSKPAKNFNKLYFRIAISCRQFGKRNKMKFAVRTLPNQNVGVWRIK